MKLKQFLLSLLILNYLFVFSQEVVWVNDSSSVDNTNWIKESTLDNNNNLYVAGYFKDKATIGSESMLSAGGYDVYVTKISASGNNIKTIQLSSTGNLYVKDIYYAHDGFVYVAGVYFNADMSIGPNIIHNMGSGDGYVAKLDVDLNLVWLQRVVTGTTFQSLSSIRMDGNNNLIISGEFKDTIRFESVSAAEVIDSSTFTKNIFIAKYDINGNYISHTIDYGATTACNSYGLEIDENNNIYLSTYFKGNVTLNGQTINSSGLEDVLICKLDNNLNYQWIRKLQGSGSEKTYSLGINSNAIYVSGTYASNDLVIDSTETQQSNITPTNNGGADMFALSYDFNGNLIWSNYFGSTGTDYLYDIETNDEVTFFSGYAAATFNYGDSTITNTTGSNNAIYLVVNSQNGIIEQYYNIGEGGDDRGATINLVKNGLNNQFFVTGTFKSDSIYIGNDTLRNSRYTRPDYGLSANVQDIFIARFGCKDISLAYQSTPTTCPGGSNGKLLAIPSEINTWAYQWQGTNATGETTAQVNNLVDSVWYYTTITSPKGCAYNDSIQMTHKPALQASLVDSITVRCAASNDGIAAVIPSAGYITGDTLTSDYHYIWDDGSTDSLRTDLTVGIHIVTISDLCQDTTQIIDTVKVGHIPTLNAYIQNQNVMVLCDTSSNGVGRVIYENGVAPYNFVWENSSSDTSVAYDLNVGIHHVTISDFCNVPIIDSVRVVNVPTIGAQITNMQNATCTGMNNGTAEVTVYNGIEPYVYQWSASTSDTAVANDLPGDSMIYVTVSDMCHQRIDSVRIGVNPSMEISIENITNARCTTTNDGSASVTLTNAQGNITYQWSASTSDTAVANDLPGDSMIYVTVSDMCGPVTDSAHIGVNPAKEITFINVQNANCQNSGDGHAEAVVTYAQDTTTYLWSTGDTLAATTTLNGGYAYLTVTDLCGPTVDSVLIGVEPAMQINPVVNDNKCNADSTGSITIETSNAFGLVKYIWANLNDTTSSLDSLAAGTYYFTVIDACQDTVIDSAVVNQPLALHDSLVVNKASDLNSNDGSVILIVSGGTPSYNYDWSNGNITSKNTNLMAGTYYYTITDVNNCTLTDSVVVEAEKYDVVIFNTFTPNGDNVNDVWNIKNIEHFPEATVKVFGQWGNEVFSSEKGYPKAWDGTNNGKELPAGTYYYIIKLDDKTPDKSGYVTIVK